MSEGKVSKLGKAKAVFTDIKTHWKTPKEGCYVPFKEYKDVFLGIGGNYVAEKTLSEYIVFAASCFLFIYHYKLPYITFSIIGLINMPLNYIWTLIWWYGCDNLGFMKKNTERKSYGVYASLIAIGLALIIGDASAFFDQSSAFILFFDKIEGMSAAAAFKILGTHLLYSGWVGARNIFWRKKLVPKFGRYKYGLYCDFIPKCIMVILVGWLPLYNIEDMATRVWAANLLFACFNVFGFANNIETVSKNISPNMRERIWVRTIPVKLSHFSWTIMNIIIPVVAGALDGEWANINVYRYVMPGTFIFFASLTMVMAGRIKERIPQPPLQRKVAINFWDGIFGVTRNKYHWINTIVGLIDALGNGMLTFTTVLYLYTFRLTGLSYALIPIILSFAGTPPDFFSPWFLKRFSYKQLMIFYQLSRAAGNAAIVASIVLCGDRVYLCGTICCIVLFLMEMTKTIPTTAGHDMGVRINDYQMYLSGERLESFAGIFGWFTGPVTTFIGLIIPLLLLKFGLNSNWDVLYVDSTRIKIIVVPIIIDVVGYLLMTIPYIFWDYDSVKQEKVIQVLERRAEVTAKKAKEEGISVEGSFIAAEALAENQEVESV